MKAFAAIAHTPGQLDTVQAVLDEKIQLDGLDIDTDLGWELLIALAAGGRAGQAEIDAALASDNTATGRQSAAHARRGHPDRRGQAGRVGLHRRIRRRCRT